jgi:hypothetical protein
VSIGAAFATGPDYDRDNPIVTLTQRAKSIRFAAPASQYVDGSLHYLFPVLALGVPADDPSLATDGRESTKEALRSYRLGDFAIVKGYVNFGGLASNFLRVETGRRDTNAVEVVIGGETRRARLNSGAVEFWNAAEGVNIAGVVADPQFPPGNPLDYHPSRVKTTTWEAGDRNDINHPLRPAPIAIRWLDSAGRMSSEHKLAYKMIRRGEESFRSSRWSQNPHGGTGSTESTVFYVSDFKDPDRLPPAFTAKYMQYVRFGPSASIGIHRHREFFDAFWVTAGSGMGVVIDGVPLDGTERTVEMRRLRAFEGMIARPGQFHGILRDTPEPLEMFAFGAAN